MTNRQLKEFLELRDKIDEFYNCEDLDDEDSYDFREILNLVENIYNRALREGDRL